MYVFFTDLHTDVTVKPASTIYGTSILWMLYTSDFFLHILFLNLIT